MKMSAECRQQITEPSKVLGLRPTKDIVGVWTIGYGHTSRAGLPKVYKRFDFIGRGKLTNFSQRTLHRSKMI